MANSPTILTTTVLALGLALLCAAGPAVAQNCNCPQGYCCSMYGYCGTTSAYCGDGCQSGPCTGGGGGGGGGANVESVVTQSFFDGIKSQDPNSCEGNNFYTRDAFLTAASTYSGFAQGESEVDGKREIAAFFANVAHETGHLCYINQINGASNSNNYCYSSAQWPCVPGKSYYGRGPLQLSTNLNYGPAGKDIGFDGLGNPDMVAQDPVVSFKTALWFRMQNVHKVVPSHHQGHQRRQRVQRWEHCRDARSGEPVHAVLPAARRRPGGQPYLLEVVLGSNVKNEVLGVAHM